jgi:hypothetical protein
MSRRRRCKVDETERSLGIIKADTKKEHRNGKTPDPPLLLTIISRMRALNE